MNGYRLPNVVESERLEVVHSTAAQYHAGIGELRAEMNDLKAALDSHFRWTVGVLMSAWITILATVIVSGLVGQ